MTEETQAPGEPGSETDEGIFAVPYPPAMYAAQILKSRTFASAMGYGWLHEQDTEFVRAFREQVLRQAELYERWLEGGEDDATSPASTDINRPG